MEYKNRKENKVVDALSRKEDDGVIVSISQPLASWIDEVHTSYKDDLEIQRLLGQFHKGELDLTQYTHHNGLLFYKGRLYLSPNSPILPKVLQQLHGSLSGGHVGYYKTLARVKADFFWKGMRSYVRHCIKECDICQQNKAENVSPTGLLQPLPIPTKIWTEISMDVIEGLPSSHGKDCIMVIVDRLSKYAHFIALSHPYTATTIARLFIDNIFKLHGMPLSIVSDQDPTFLSSFLKEFFKL